MICRLEQLQHRQKATQMSRLVAIADIDLRTGIPVLPFLSVPFFSPFTARLILFSALSTLESPRLLVPPRQFGDSTHTQSIRGRKLSNQLLRITRQIALFAETEHSSVEELTTQHETAIGLISETQFHNLAPNVSPPAGRWLRSSSFTLLTPLIYTKYWRRNDG